MRNKRGIDIGKHQRPLRQRPCIKSTIRRHSPLVGGRIRPIPGPGPLRRLNDQATVEQILIHMRSTVPIHPPTEPRIRNMKQQRTDQNIQRALAVAGGNRDAGVTSHNSRISARNTTIEEIRQPRSRIALSDQSLTQDTSMRNKRAQIMRRLIPWPRRRSRRNMSVLAGCNHMRHLKA